MENEIIFSKKKKLSSVNLYNYITRPLTRDVNTTLLRHETSMEEMSYTLSGYIFVVVLPFSRNLVHAEISETSNRENLRMAIFLAFWRISSNF